MSLANTASEREKLLENRLKEIEEKFQKLQESLSLSLGSKGKGRGKNRKSPSTSRPDDIEIQMHILDDLGNSYNDIDNYEMEYFEE